MPIKEEVTKDTVLMIFDGQVTSIGHDCVIVDISNYESFYICVACRDMATSTACIVSIEQSDTFDPFSGEYVPENTWVYPAPLAIGSPTAIGQEFVKQGYFGTKRYIRPQIYSNEGDVTLSIIFVGRPKVQSTSQKGI